MAEGLGFHRCLLFLTFVFVCEISHAYGTICSSSSSSFSSHTWVCSFDEYCCGYDSCCNTNSSFKSPTDFRSLFIVLVIIALFVICCPICCYRCCCRRTTSQGFVYQQNPPTTTVAVTLPPQQSQPNVPYPNSMPPYPNTTPYPNTMPYPQTSPYNPYYGQHQPPPYTMAQEHNQQASAPAASAPPY